VVFPHWPADIGPRRHSNALPADGSHHVGKGWNVSLTYSDVQYIPGTGSPFTDTAIFKTTGAVLHWKPVGRV